MANKALNRAHLESLIEDLSDEELGSCVGGLSLYLCEPITGGSTVSLGGTNNLATVDLVPNAKIPVSTSNQVGGTTTDIGLNNSLYATCRQC